jgi:uncharacterized membrane protein YgcG
MNAKWTLVFAGGVTAFVLVVIGAVAGRASADNGAPTPTATTVDPAVLQQLDERDAAYRQMIDQANQQLQEAYQKIATLEATQPAPTQESVTQTYPISADLAVGLALNLAPGSRLVRWPELVDFNGTAAWEVILNSGTMYLDATNAVLLYNGVGSSSGSSGGGGGGGGGDDGGHEGDD